MKLKVFERKGSTKGQTRAIRREGNIPAVLYSSGKAGENVYVDGVEFRTVLRNVIPGRLSTMQFSLDRDGKEVKAILKEVQYHPTSYEVIHVDFMVLQETLTVKVPIECVGVSDCQGIKLGGFLRQVIRYLKVECSAVSIPEFFTIDIRNLVIGQSLRLSDLSLPQGVRPLANMKEAVVVIAKR